MRSTYYNPIVYLVTVHNLTTFYSVRFISWYIFKIKREKIVPMTLIFVLKIIIRGIEQYNVCGEERKRRWIRLGDKKFRFLSAYFRIMSKKETNRLISLINKSRFDRLPFDTREILSDITSLDDYVVFSDANNLCHLLRCWQSGSCGIFDFNRRN